MDDENVVPGPALTIYRPAWQIGVAGRLFVRAAGDPYALVPAVTRVIREISAEQPVERAATLEDVRAEVLSPERLNAFVFSGFAGIALLIAVVGVAGVLAFSVSARTREFGVRLAIGSSPRHLLAGVLGEGALIAAIGIAVGGRGRLRARERGGDILRNCAAAGRAASPWRGLRPRRRRRPRLAAACRTSVAGRRPAGAPVGVKMTANYIQGSTAQKPLRLWPGVVLAILVGLLRYVVPAVAPEDFTVSDVPLGFLGFLGGVLSALAIVVWWVFFSRVPWSERAGAIILSIVGLFAVSRMVHESITGGMMGMLLYVYSIPVLSLALVVWAVVAGRLAPGARRAWLVAIILLACAPWTLLRTAGTFGAGSEFHWRWTPTPEQRLLAQASAETPKSLPPPAAPAEAPKAPATVDTGDKPAAVPPAPAAAAKADVVDRAATETRVEGPP